MPNLPKQIPMQLLLYKTTTCLTRPATTFFDSQIKEKPVQNNNYKTLSSKGMQKKHKEQCIKNECLSDYIYSISNS